MHQEPTKRPTMAAAFIEFQELARATSTAQLRQRAVAASPESNMFRGIWADVMYVAHRVQASALGLGRTVE